MAYSVDWIAKIITIPASDLVLVSGTHYRLSMSDFLIEIRRLESAFDEGLWADDILDHTNTKVDFAGTDYAAFDEVINGYTIQFGAGPTRVDVTGSNNNIVDVLIPTGISVVPSNSAGLVNSADLKAPTFLGNNGLGIHIDTVGGTDSELYPIGNATSPCKTEANIHGIYSGGRNYKSVYVKEALTLTMDHSIMKHIWVGDSPLETAITVNGSANVSENAFHYCYVSGDMNGASIIRECIIGNTTNVSNYIYESALQGPIVLNNDAAFIACFISGSATGLEVDIDFNGLQKTVLIEGWKGGTVNVKNMVTGSIFGIGGTAGSFKIDATCTGGAINHGGAIRLKEQNGTLDSINDASTANQVLTKAQTTPIYSDVKKVNNITITGSGTEADPWGP